MKVSFLLLWPINTLRRLSIPVYTIDTWSKTQASLSPLFILILLLHHFEGILSSEKSYIPYLLAILLGLILGAIIYRTSRNTALPRYNTWLVFIGFGMSILWICNICSMMIDLLNLASNIMQFPPPVLGMTLLAWGNSSADLVANLAIAKIGLSSTALTACFAGPLFNLLLGLGVSLMISSYDDGVEFRIFERADIVIGLVSLVCSLSIAIATVIIEKGEIGRRFGGIMIGCYGTFSLVLVSFLYELE
jgi:sodium/potassium/calcium exchanger 6